MNQNLRVITITITIFLLLTSCNVFKSDEEIIEDRINKFLTEYNSGDYEEVLECFTPKMKNTLKSATGIGDAILGKLTGINLKSSDLFGFGAGILSQDDVLTISDAKLTLENETTATVECILTFKNNLIGKSTTQKSSFIMSKEKNDWLIQNIKLID